MHEFYFLWGSLSLDLKTFKISQKARPQDYH